jgi:G:T/U-mismatch repair DNA glycosylase
MDEGMKTEEPHPDWYYPVQGMRALILGTFPPHVRKRDYEFYYPNNQNRFWKVMAKIANTQRSQDEGPQAVEERKMLMTQLKVEVQNVGKTILRHGVSSADNDIEIIESQDVMGIINENDTLQAILLTGYSGKTSTYGEFVKYPTKNQIQHNQPEKVRAGYEFTVQFKKPVTCIIGNSTSMAAARSVSCEDLLKQFKSAILRYRAACWGASSRTRSPERIPNSQRSVNHLPMLQVLRIKRGAVRFDSRGGDLRVIDAEPVLPRDLQRRLMRIQRDCNWRREQDSNCIECFDQVLPGHAHLTSCDCDEFVQNLNADDSALRY